MKTVKRPRVEGEPATLRQKLGALVAGKPLHLPGTFEYHREDFADVQRQSRAEEPLAMARRMARIFKSDHAKLDKLDNTDSLYNEMDYDAVCGGARQRYEEALTAAKLRIDVAPEFEAYCASVTRPGGALMADLTARTVDSEMRGFVLGETLVSRIDRGDYAGYDTIGEIRRLERDAYRLEEDEFSRPAKLELWVTDDAVFTKQQRTGQTRFIGGTYRPQKQVILMPGDPDWDRYLFLTYPERGNRTAGLPRYGAAFPWYFFLIHLRQWYMTLCERTGTPILVAEFTPQGNLVGDQYQITADDMFAILEKIQTNFRGLVPAGYKVSAVATGAEGLAALIEGAMMTCRRMCEVAVLGEDVSGGTQAAGGTLGANQTIMQTTFGGHIAAGHRRIGARLARLLEFLIEKNFGERADVEVEFEAVDPAKEAAKVSNLEKGIALGIVSQHEPWARDLLGAPPLDDALLAATQAAKSDAVRYGLVEGAAVPAPAGGSALNVDQVLEVVDRVQEGDIGEGMAATLLAQQIGVTIEEARALVAEETARRRGEPAAVQATGGVTLTPSDLASITTVNEGRASAGLPPLSGPDGLLTIAEFTAKRSAAAEVTGEAAGKAVTGEAAQPAQPAQPAQSFSEAAIISAHRMRDAMATLRRFVHARYDAVAPLPIIHGFSSAVGAFGLDAGEKRRRVEILRGRIHDGLAARLAGVTSDEAALAAFDELSAHYTRPEVMEEFGDV